jgi:glucose-6-phosphate isomerase
MQGAHTYINNKIIAFLARRFLQIFILTGYVF